tara:strand:- start:27 stop:665 length:639 start_codon:yes stop_codon:yes gene_type:complete
MELRIVKMGVISNGTTLLDAGALDSGVATGAMTLIKTLTASSSATLSFVDGASSVVLDNTYKEYVFKFFNMHPANDTQEFQFNMSADTGSNYNVTKTTTYFRTYHDEADTSTTLAYRTGNDLAQSTNFQMLADGVGNGNDECCSGILHLFDPSNTTFVKHFTSRISTYENNNGIRDNYVAGYGNTTSAVDAVQFKFGSGNIDAGTIKMYGIK